MLTRRTQALGTNNVDEGVPCGIMVDEAFLLDLLYVVFKFEKILHLRMIFRLNVLGSWFIRITDFFLVFFVKK